MTVIKQLAACVGRKRYWQSYFNYYINTTTPKKQQMAHLRSDKGPYSAFDCTFD